MGLVYCLSRIWFLFVNLVAFIVAKCKTREKVPPLNNPLTSVSAAEIAAKIRSGEAKSEDVVKAFIERIRLVNPLLNCVVETNFDSALALARQIDEDIRNGKNLQDKPFLGVPFTMKDCITAKGLLCTAGIFCRKDSRMDGDATVVSRMKDAGAILLAITNVSEVCMWWESSNKIYGRTNNPYDTRRIVGGSSGGEAALLASGGSPMGLGSDIGGSIRMPAFFNGIFGHKPSPEVVPDDGTVPPVKEYPAFMHTVGPMSRFAEDLTPMMKVLVGPTTAARLRLGEKVDISTLRIFYMSDMVTACVGSLESDQRWALKKVVRHFEKNLNKVVIKLDLPLVHFSLGLWLNDMEEKSSPKFSEEMLNREGDLNAVGELFTRWLLNRSVHTLPALGLALFEQFSAKFLQSPSQRQFLITMREKLVRQLEELLGTDGIFLFPTHPTAAPLHNQPILQPMNFGYTAVFNTLALPATHVPLGLNSAGLPAVGIQVVAARNQDRLCLAVAMELEKAFGGWVKP